MISTDFAPNEFSDDASLSFRLLFQPWRWNHGPEILDARSMVQELLYPPTNNQRPTTFFCLSGRAALYYYFRALDLTAQSDILIQAFTCEAVPLPIIANNLKPVYVDIEQETFSMDINDLKRKTTPNSKVLILQHTYGITPKYRNEILTFAKENNLTILEDLAHGWDPKLMIDDQFTSPKLSSEGGQPITILLSFGRSKAFSSVFGGAIVTTDTTIAKKLAEMEKQLSYPTSLFIFRALLYKPLSVLIKSTYDIYFGKILHKILKVFNLLIPEITEKEKQGEYDTLFAKAYPNALAILLIHQLTKYQKMMEQRVEAVKQYTQYFKTNIPSTNMLRFPLLREDRDEILKKAVQNNIFFGKWYDQAVAPKQLDLDKVQYEKLSCPVAEDAAKKIVNLPTLVANTSTLDVILKHVLQDP